jgi:hypothetical protein
VTARYDNDGKPFTITTVRRLTATTCPKSLINPDVSATSSLAYWSTARSTALRLPKRYSHTSGGKPFIFTLLSLSMMYGSNASSVRDFITSRR